MDKDIDDIINENPEPTKDELRRSELSMKWL